MMKKSLKFLVMLVFLLMFSFAFFACGDDEEESGEDEEEFVFDGETIEIIRGNS